MERKKYLLIVFFGILLVPSVGQSHITIYHAYINGDMVAWKSAMDSLDAVQRKTNKDKLDLINYQYGYVAWCIDRDKKKEAERYMEKAEEQIGYLQKQKYQESMLLAYKAAFIGYKIGLSPQKAPFIGSESIKYAKQAVKSDPSNALGHIQLGNIAYFTPRIFGGSKTEAMQHYLHALKLMESRPGETVHNWNYLNLFATIIHASMEMEDYLTAKYYCEKTLSAEPRFHWVRYQLYPQVLKKLNDE
ncbi:MAG TPA: hypothetical protein ENN63_12020 [Bacteroidetes bacterium]|nr:hypothetical protein [Bacteroidota bacterium]